MFEKLKYRIVTMNYFNPIIREKKPRLDVSREDILQILRGEVVNPKKLEDIRCNYYSFMIVGAPLNSPLNSWAGGQWGVNNSLIVQESADWYMRAYHAGTYFTSQITVPSRKLVIDIEPNAMSNFGRVFSHRTTTDQFRLGSTMDLKTDWGSRILVSNLSIADLSKCIKLTFPD